LPTHLNAKVMMVFNQRITGSTAKTFFNERLLRLNKGPLPCGGGSTLRHRYQAKNNAKTRNRNLQV
jgi:hypothetical protein